jgi:bacillithiol biosynthesis deacetylase BshB1
MEHGVDLLIFAAHPDDAEIGMGGTIAKQVALGQKVVICDLTRAECSSNGTPEERQREAEHASAVLGTFSRYNLGFPDRGIEPGNQEQLVAIVKLIRTLRPRVVFAPHWVDRHPDHVACSQLVKEAVFNAKLRNWHGEIEAQAWAVDRLVYYFINDVHKPDFIVDISEYQVQKMDGLRAYESQFTAPSTANDFVVTPLNQAYLERVMSRDFLLGQANQVGYAEGFVSAQPLVVERL